MSERTLAPFGRRRLEVVGRRAVGAYVLLSVADPDGPVPDPGQFAMLAAAERWGGGADERPFLPRAFSIAPSMRPWAGIERRSPPNSNSAEKAARSMSEGSTKSTPWARSDASIPLC